MNLNDLVFFVHVVEQGGFTAAARRLGVPKSTVSKRVAELEEGLGVRLLHRNPRSLALTDAGQDVLRHARAVLIEAESVQAVVQRRRAEPAGTVRLTASVPVAQGLAPHLPALARAHPRLLLQLHATDRFVDLVLEGYDLAVRSHFAPLPDSALVQRPLGVEPVILVASPPYVQQHGSPPEPAALASHRGLLVGPSAVRWRLTDARGARCEVAPIPALVADETQVLLGAAEAGLGIACLPLGQCGPALRDGRLVRLLDGWTAGQVTTTLLMPARRGELPAVRAVVDFLSARWSADSLDAGPHRGFHDDGGNTDG